MDHHELSNSPYRTSRTLQGGSADSNVMSNYFPVAPDSPPIQTAAFRSQKITAAAAPLLHPNLTKLPVASKAVPFASAQDDGPPLARVKKDAIGTIPFFPSFHIPERTAIQIPEASMSVDTLLDRVLHYLRIHSISYECEADTGCLECMAPNMVGFVVQLWRRNNDDNTGRQWWVEVQRREGCSIALHAIRRGLLRHVQGVEPEPPAAAAGRRRPFADTDLQHTANSNKRRRSLSPYAARSMDCQDALAISVRLLESTQRDQNRLGLESLTVLTDSRLVRAQDAVTASRALVLGEGPAGPRLQLRLATLLQELQPVLAAAGDSPDLSAAYVARTLFCLALHALANGLEQVSRDNSSIMALRICVRSPFWQIVVPYLLFSLDDAARRPHEAALSARCVRFLLPARACSETLNGPTVQPVLRKVNELGRAYNKSLEVESQKTLCLL